MIRKWRLLIAKYDVACCLMHNKSNTEYQNFLIDMLAETQECVNLARQAGIKDEKIMLDPGIGFGKTFEMNLEAMNHLELFQNLGFPVLPWYIPQIHDRTGTGSSCRSARGGDFGYQCNWRNEGMLFCPCPRC